MADAPRGADEPHRTPLDYAVAKAIEHQIVTFSESHEHQDQLRLLNHLIPQPCHRAGVRCVAVEVCRAEDNAAIEVLVTAPEFDRDLAMQIARR